MLRQRKPNREKERRQIYARAPSALRHRMMDGRGERGGTMRIRWTLGILVGVLVLAGPSAHAATWSRQYIRQLPDSAFAAIEKMPEGKALRHLPHHDANGVLDVPHLCNALSRLNQVKWRDPANAESARRHLTEHLKEVGQRSCRPAPRGGS